MAHAALALPNSENIIDRLQNTYAQAKTWQANFVQKTHVELLAKNIAKNGDIFIKKPGKIRIDYEGQNQKLYVSNGTKLWVQVKGEDQVQTYNNVDKVIAAEALTFLSGFGNLKKDFRINLLVAADHGEWMMEDTQLSLLALNPRNRNAIFNQIILGVDKDEASVREMTLYNKSGNRSHYLFKNIRFNKDLPDELFILKE